jgi:2,3-bisphosphoglycerate-dependent phosphoglycerate mutase
MQIYCQNNPHPNPLPEGEGILKAYYSHLRLGEGAEVRVKMSTLVLLRHGESMWNKKNVFTGWVDVPLSITGIDEALKAGAKIADINFDIIYTSTLVRAMQTTMLCMTKNNSSKTPIVIHTEGGKQEAWSKIYSKEMQKEIIPVYADWHLNERYYGELQGHNKAQTAELYGEKQVHLWRRSYDIPPPNGECLKDTAARTIPFFKEKIIPLLEDNNNILVVAHGNSLRSIVMHLDNLSEQQVLDLEIATGDPILYAYEKNGIFKC